MSQIRILIVEDDVIIAESIHDCLDSIDYEVSDIVYSKTAALSALRNNPPDMALLDINLQGGIEGIEIAKWINEHMQIPFIFLTSYANKSIIDQVKHTRPMGYIVKPFDEKDLFTTIEIAYYNYSQNRKNLSWNLKEFNGRIMNPLTEKEFEILQDLYKGLTNKQLCEKHFVSVNTIKTHVRRIYDKLDVHYRSAAVARTREVLEG
ncbi:MAG: response regulator [Bacteroidota bacterium]